MVVKISAPAESCISSFNYNDFKVENGVASILAMWNIDDPDNPLDTLLRYEAARRRCRKPSFHMSINPSDTDGMSEEQVIHLFEPYKTNKAFGTGLGLMISARIVRGHGGSISVESKPGEGTTFILKLPRLERRIRVLK